MVLGHSAIPVVEADTLNQSNEPAGLPCNAEALWAGSRDIESQGRPVVTEKAERVCKSTKGTVAYSCCQHCNKLC